MPEPSMRTSGPPEKGQAGIGLGAAVAAGAAAGVLTAAATNLLMASNRPAEVSQRLMALLKEIKALYDFGVFTQPEFLQMRAIILAKLQGGPANLGNTGQASSPGLVQQKKKKQYTAASKTGADIMDAVEIEGDVNDEDIMDPIDFDAEGDDDVMDPDAESDLDDEDVMDAVDVDSDDEANVMDAVEEDSDVGEEEDIETNEASDLDNNDSEDMDDASNLDDIDQSSDPGTDDMADSGGSSDYSGGMGGEDE